MENATGTLERTIAIDRGLAHRADRKLRRYGRDFNDVVTYLLHELVSRRGNPIPDGESPGQRLISSFKEAEMMGGRTPAVQTLLKRRRAYCRLPEMRTQFKTSEFKRYVKLLNRRHWDLSKLSKVMNKLA